MNFIEIFSKRKRSKSNLDPSKIGKGEGRMIARLMAKDLIQFAETEEWLKEKAPELCESLKYKD